MSIILFKATRENKGNSVRFQSVNLYKFCNADITGFEFVSIGGPGVLYLFVVQSLSIIATTCILNATVHF